MSGFMTLRRRILLTVIALLLATVGSTMAVLYVKMKDAAARGDYLAKHMSRYLSYQEMEQGALLVAVRALVKDERLARALAARDNEEVEEARKRLAREIEEYLPIDLLAIFDPFVQVVSATGRHKTLADSARLFTRVPEGESLSATVLLADMKVFQIAAAPVLNESNKPVGFVLAGRRIARPFLAYSKDSDSRKSKQHQVALVLDGQALESTIAADERGDLADRLADRRLEAEGDFMATVFDFGGQTFDLHERTIELRTHEGKTATAALDLFRVRESYEERVTENLYPVLYVGIGGLLAALVLAFLLSRTIARPIRTFTTSIRTLIEGEADLSRRLPVRGKDELAQLAIAINELNDKVNSLVCRIRDASLRLGQSAQEISHVAMRTLQGAQGQVEKIESSSSLTNELSRTIQEISSRANQGAQIAGLGRDSVEKTDSGMTRIRDAVHLSWNKVGDLKSNVEKIGAIAELISKITEENSMLALNASIEAARAGAAGQGFAVVAQQMREQAKRVEKSSREIIENIRSIQSITQELVASMDDSRTDVDRGGQLVNVTLHHLTELSAIMQETAEAVKEQAAASDDIAQMTVDVQRIGNEALEASQQTVEEGERIRDKAQELALLVGRFKARELADGTAPTRLQLPPAEGGQEY